MRHCSPEDLALSALGEDLPPAEALHLTGCPTCTAEVASLRRAVDALDGPDVDPAVPLPARVWDAIAAETGVSSRPRPAETPGRTAVPTPRTGAPEARPPGAWPLGPPRRADVAALPARPAGPRRRQRWLVGGAVAASLLVGVGLGAVALPRGGDDGGRAVAEVALAPVDGGTATGAATLVDRDGALQLRVELATPPAGDGFYEVWLLGGDAGAVALGVLEGGSGSYPLPAGVDLTAYGVVDVSLEPFDGDPEHSTDSVARGDLT